LKPTKIQLKRIAEREKRQAAFHEAGHAAVCSHFGGVGKPEVWSNSSQNIKEGERAWRGKFEIFAEPGTVLIDEETNLALGLIVLPAPENWRVLFGIAGLVAEYIADGVTSAEEIAYSIDDAIMMNEVSRSDLDWMGEDWEVTDVAEVLQLLLDMWPDIERNAAWLIECSI
jgi:hypothetical protein